MYAAYYCRLESLLCLSGTFFTARVKNTPPEVQLFNEDNYPLLITKYETPYLTHPSA